MLFLIFLGVTFAIYAGIFSSQWVYDDYPVIVNNPDVTSLQNFLKDSYPGRPLRELTYMADHALWGFEPAGFLLQNLLWHSLCGFLVYLLAFRLGLSRAVSVWAALVFLAHPLMVEVVAHAAHRKDSLALCFSLLSLLAFLGFLDGKGRPRRRLAAAGLFLLVACLAKENAVAVLPVAAGLWVWRRGFGGRTLAWAAGGGAVCGVAALALLVRTSFWQQQAKLHLLKVQIAADFGPWDYYLYVLKAWSFMFSKLLWPADLSVEYVLQPPASALNPWVLSSLGLAVLSAALLMLSWRKNLPLFAGILFFWAFWLPVSNLLPLAYFAADRYLYAPMAGFALVLGAGGQWLRGRSGYLFGSLGAITVLVLAVLSFEQQQVWRNNDSLWGHAYRVSPESSTVLNNLGNLALERGGLVEARDFYLRSLGRDPYNHAARYNLGYIAEMRGMPAEALEHYREFVKYDHSEAMFRRAAEALRARFNLPRPPGR